MIRVVDVRKLRTPAERATVAYVGRRFAGWPGHDLGNPFRWPTQGGRSPVDLYRELIEVMRSGGTLNPMLDRLWAECERGAKPLGCWCCDSTYGDGQPVVCHAQVIAAELVRRFLPDLLCPS